jgi:YggT family protein
MSPLLNVYAAGVAVVRIALFVLAAAMTVVVVVDWAVRTRRISPFSGVARFFRRVVDPRMVPVERTVIRAGGKPSSAPWWALVTVVIGGLILLFLLEAAGGLLRQLLAGVSDPRVLPVLLVSWVFGLLKLALIVRVVSTWLPISPYSRWIRWSYVLTDWFITPIRRLIPPLGMFDLTPLIAYVALAWVLEPLIVGGVQRVVGV